MQRRTMAVIVLVAAIMAIAWLLVPFQRWGLWDLYEARNGTALADLGHDIASQTEFDSIEIGQEGTLTTEQGAQPYDSSYFINGDAVTHYPRAGLMNGEKPVLEVDDYLDDHALSPTRYDEFVRRMESLGIKGFDKTEAGVAFQVEVDELFSSDNDMVNLYYLPNGELTTEPQ